MRRSQNSPPFDPNNIESWIRQVKATYTRAAVTDPTDKFAFLESVIPVDTHPKLNEFFSGPSSEAKWEELLQFLRFWYGRMRRQQAQSAIDGIKRDGCTPTDILALLRDDVSQVTMDDVIKEQLVRQLPATVHHALAKVDVMSDT